MNAKASATDHRARPMRVAILGATGSIGGSTLDVLARHPERYEVFALTAHARTDELAQLVRRFRPAFAVVAGPQEAAALAAQMAPDARTEILHGAQALMDLAAHPQVDAVMAAIVGAAGLPACLAAARAGKRLMLANKEALVVGGRLFVDAVAEGGAALLPVDSEHSAIFQCLPGDRAQWAGHVDHIVLTASGGPFRSREPSSLVDVTPDEACAHPNWVMGRKISVDSATMMNKALEVIEARWLFDLVPEQVRVVLHPQSIIHSMVVCRDHSVLAQLGTPDMRVPIAVALAWPERVASGAGALDFLKVPSLTFEEADARRFPALPLAWDAMAGPEGSTAVLNAANEVAVAAFLERRIRFTDIARINAEALDAVLPSAADAASLGDLLALDARARAWSAARVQALAA